MIDLNSWFESGSVHVQSAAGNRRRQTANTTIAAIGLTRTLRFHVMRHHRLQMWRRVRHRSLVPVHYWSDLSIRLAIDDDRMESVVEEGRRDHGRMLHNLHERRRWTEEWLRTEDGLMTCRSQLLSSGVHWRQKQWEWPANGTRLRLGLKWHERLWKERKGCERMSYGHHRRHEW